MKDRCRRFHTQAGSKVFLMESHHLPLVDIQFTLRTGSVEDPNGLEGLSRITARMIRMGTRGLSADQVEEAIDRLGAQLTILCTSSYVHFSCIVLEQNLESFLALFADLFCKPAWRVSDLNFIKRETIANIIEARDNDHVLSARHFRKFALGDHPYARPVIGSQTSVHSINRSHVIQHYRRYYVAENLIIGASGAVGEENLRYYLDKYLRNLRVSKPPKRILRPPSLIRGRRLLVVDKPARTQTQILIGTLGARIHDPDYFPFQVGNTVFGGTFTARLMVEIRSKRGWSYGASSRLSIDRQRDLWSMWAFPSSTDAVACIKLQLSMLEKWVDRGITQKELVFAKRNLANSYAFEIDTPIKRLNQCIDKELFRLPTDFYLKYVDNIRSVTRKQVNHAIKKLISKQDVTIVMVATYSDISLQLERIPNLSSISVVPFDAEW